MHTLKVLAVSFLLLGVCLAACHGAKVSRPTRLGAAIFLPLWLVGSAVNLWIGVVREGYTIQEELPILAIVFGLPAIVAIVLIRLAGGAPPTENPPNE